MVQPPLAGDNIEADDLYNVTAFTPTWTGLTQGSGAVNEGWYGTLGEWVFWQFRFEGGTSAALTASSLLIQLPVTASTGGGVALQSTLGSWIIRVSASAHYAGSLGNFEAAGTNASFAGAWNGSAPSARAGTSGPSGFTTGSIISGGGVYRAA